MGHLVGKAQLLNGRSAVAAANPSMTAALLDEHSTRPFEKLIIDARRVVAATRPDISPYVLDEVQGSVLDAFEAGKITWGQVGALFTAACRHENPQAHILELIDAFVPASE